MRSRQLSATLGITRGGVPPMCPEVPPAGRAITAHVTSSERVSAPAAHVRPPVGGFLHQLVLDSCDNTKCPALQLADIDEAKR